MGLLLMIGAAGIFPAVASADYAVLRSGARLHITGYERDGERVRLTVDGGTVSVAAADLVAVEPEEHFAAVPAAAVAPGPFGNLIHAAAEKHGVDESLIRWVIAVESNFNPRAVSRRRAQGLMQLLPSTAALYAVGNIFDPAENIDAGTHYLKDLLTRYQRGLAVGAGGLQRWAGDGGALWRSAAFSGDAEVCAGDYRAYGWARTEFGGEELVIVLRGEFFLDEITSTTPPCRGDFGPRPFKQR